MKPRPDWATIPESKKFTIFYDPIFIIQKQSFLCFWVKKLIENVFLSNLKLLKMELEKSTAAQAEERVCRTINCNLQLGVSWSLLFM